MKRWSLWHSDAGGHLGGLRHHAIVANDRAARRRRPLATAKPQPTPEPPPDSEGQNPPPVPNIVPMYKPKPVRSNKPTAAQIRWLQTAAQRGPSLAAQLSIFVGEAQPPQSLKCWTSVACQARQQLVGLNELRQPIQDNLCLPLPELCSPNEALRRYALAQTDVELCTLITHWVSTPVAAIASMPRDAVSQQGAVGDAVRLDMQLAEIASMSLGTAVARACALDQQASPTPRLLSLCGARLHLRDFAGELRIARRIDPT